MIHVHHARNDRRDVETNHRLVHEHIGANKTPPCPMRCRLPYSSIRTDIKVYFTAPDLNLQTHVPQHPCEVQAFAFSSFRTLPPCYRQKFSDMAGHPEIDLRSDVNLVGSWRESSNKLTKRGPGLWNSSTTLVSRCYCSTMDPSIVAERIEEVMVLCRALHLPVQSPFLHVKRDVAHPIPGLDAQRHRHVVNRGFRVMMSSVSVASMGFGHLSHKHFHSHTQTS